MTLLECLKVLNSIFLGRIYNVIDSMQSFGIVSIHKITLVTARNFNRILFKTHLSVKN